MTKSRMLYFSVLVSAFLLSGGCATQYQLPTSEPHAKVRFITTTGGAKRVLIFENDKCEKGEIGGQIAVVGGLGFTTEDNKLKMYDPPTKSLRVREREISANKAIVVAFSIDPSGYTAPIGSCPVSVIFVPKENRQYEVVHTYSMGMCGAAVVELMKTPDGEISRIREPSARVLERPCSYSDL